MSIKIARGTTKREWLKLTGALVETSLKALTLGKDGFSAAAPPLFRAFEALRGTDSIERRAARLVSETLSYAIAATISTVPLARIPSAPEIDSIVRSLLNRTEALCEQNDILLNVSHIQHPASLPLFEDIAKRIFHEIKPSEPKVSEQNVIARFQNFIIEGLSRTRTRGADYYSLVFDSLSGPEAHADAKRTAWDNYRQLLVKKFEDEPLFAEDKSTGVTLAQIYQGLRAWWDEDGDYESTPPVRAKKTRRHVRLLEDLVDEWLASTDGSDRLRLISGGPGSGKSTFAKRLAARLSSSEHWRTVLVPLQRLRGRGPLERRIDEYFRLQGDEPFSADSGPLASLGRDGHRDWLIIFDGLDELAKEGPGSESAAQDFASELADWRGRISHEVTVRFIALGRAPSMQDARRRLGLHGAGTIHVAGMAPFSKLKPSNHENVLFVDPLKLREIDQRPDFWLKWASAKGLPSELPEAMTVDALIDLTNEPLLAFLLILSGYVGKQWHEAAENRNRIYRAIFNEIWERERQKPSRRHLNDLKKEGFEALLQSLGLAAWRGGGRTGTEEVFVAVRDVFMRRDLLVAASACGASDLSNVALLFYTRKDEEGGSGYEFLHKSFGEYLTARGLFDAFQRWGDQFANPTADFDETDFLRKWLKLTGPAPITREILRFMRNEARLMSSDANAGKPWKRARDLLPTATSIMNVAVRDGLPAHEGASYWRTAEAQQRNAEEALFGLVDSLARAAYPIELFSVKADGGWHPGPVRIAEFNKSDTFSRFLARMNNVTGGGWIASEQLFSRFGLSQAESMLTRLALEEIMFVGHVMSSVSFYGSSFDRAALVGCTFEGANFSCTSMRSTHFHYTRLSEVQFYSSDIAEADFSDCVYLESRGEKVHATKVTRKFIERRTELERAPNRRVNAVDDVNTVIGDGVRFSLT